MFGGTVVRRYIDFFFQFSFYTYSKSELKIYFYETVGLSNPLLNNGILVGANREMMDQSLVPRK